VNYIIDGYFGFGDNIYHIPFVHHLSKQGEVFIYTPFPELFQFPKVYCYKPTTNLKLQLENMNNNGLYARSCAHHPNGKRIRFNYGEGFRTGKSILQTFESVVPLHGDFYFQHTPDVTSSVDIILKRSRSSGKKLCVIRLPSVRNEWPNPNRNAHMKYFQACIHALRDRYYFVSVGDIGNREEFDGDKPDGLDECREQHTENHLGIWEVIDLINRSDMVISIQCNLLPICQLLRKKGFFIYGGYVPHRVLNDERMFQVGFIEPEPFCFCIENGNHGPHLCKKDIPEDELLSRLESYVAGEPWN
jgi:hypothetical protein